jgi:hypothetical protein
MKRFVFSLLIFSLFLTACPHPQDVDPGSDKILLGALSSVKTKGIKSLYSSKILLSGGLARAVLNDTAIQTLSYINASGQNTPIIFTTSSGLDVVLQVSRVKPVGKAFLIVEFTALYAIEGSDTEGYTYTEEMTRQGKALVNMQSGAIYDFSAYSTDELVLSENIVYAVGASNKTLYKINLSNITQAVPLNNPVYNPVSKIYVKIGNKIICPDQNSYTIKYISFDINGSYLPQETSFWYMKLASEGYQNYYMNVFTEARPNGIITKSNGEVWFYGLWHEVFTAGVEKNQFIRFKLEIGNNGDMSYTDYEEIDLPFGVDQYGWSIYETDEKLLFVCYYGFHTVDIRPGHELQIDSTAFNVPHVASGLLYNNTLYGLSNTDIHALELTANGIDQVIYSNPAIVNPVTSGGKNITLTLSGDNLIFYQYANATTVNTYTLSVSYPDATPVILSTSTANVQDILELNF